MCHTLTHERSRFCAVEVKGFWFFHTYSTLLFQFNTLGLLNSSSVESEWNIVLRVIFYNSFPFDYSLSHNLLSLKQ